MTKTLDFRSDTVTQPSAAMRDAMMSAQLGDDVFGDDPSINRLQANTAQQLGFEAALFAPTGTQTNLIALMTHCGRGDEALVGQLWHTYRWEAGGMAVLGSIQPQPLENQADGTIRIEDLQAAIKPDDAHFAKTKLVVIENTTGGKVLPQSYIDSIGVFAKHNHLSTHLDGARLMNAAVATAALTSSVPTHDQCIDAARALAKPFGSVSLCLSKGLGASVGSLLLGSQAFITAAKRYRKMLGGGMRQAGFLAAAGSYALEHNVARLHQDHTLAKRLADGLSRFEFLTIASVHTNILFVRVAADLATKFTAHLKEHGVLHTGVDYQRWVTHLDVNEASVAKALDVVAAFKT